MTVQEIARAAEELSHDPWIDPRRLAALLAELARQLSREE